MRRLIDYTKQGRIVSEGESQIHCNDSLGAVNKRFSIGKARRRSSASSVISNDVSSLEDPNKRRRRRRQSHASICSTKALLRGEVNERRLSDSSGPIPTTLDLDLSDVLKESKRPPILLTPVPNSRSVSCLGADLLDHDDDISLPLEDKKTLHDDEEEELIEFYLKIPSRKNRRAPNPGNDIRKRFARGFSRSNSLRSTSSTKRKSLIENMIFSEKINKVSFRNMTRKPLRTQSH